MGRACRCDCRRRRKQRVVKRGRPPIWRSPAGEAFVEAVQELRAEKGGSITSAIRQVLKRPEMAQFKTYDQRILEKRYQEALEFHNPFAAIHKAYKRNIRNK
jgi:hypothetical protein